MASANMAQYCLLCLIDRRLLSLNNPRFTTLDDGEGSFDFKANFFMCRCYGKRMLEGWDISDPFRWWYFEQFVIPLTRWHRRGPSWPVTGVRGDPDSQKPWLLLKPAGRCSLCPASPAGNVPPLTCLCVCLPDSVCPFVRPSVRQAGKTWSLDYKNAQWYLKGQ